MPVQGSEGSYAFFCPQMANSRQYECSVILHRASGTHGYDEGDGNIGNEYAHEFSDPNPADIFGMAKRAVAFMERNKRANKPFFVQMSWHALHAPQNAMKETLAKYAQKMNSSVDEKRVGAAAIAENLDTGVGMVVDAVDRLGLGDNTFVIYMSDNGSGGRGGRAGLAGGSICARWPLAHAFTSIAAGDHSAQH